MSNVFYILSLLNGLIWLLLVIYCSKPIFSLSSKSINTIYRSPGSIANIDTEELPDIRESCPQCYLSLKEIICDAGHLTSVRASSLCSIGTCYATYKARVPPKICSPTKRLGKFFKKCKIKGVHLHQECKKCGWKDISKLTELFVQQNLL